MAQATYLTFQLFILFKTQSNNTFFKWFDQIKWRQLDWAECLELGGCVQCHVHYCWKSLMCSWSCIFPFSSSLLFGNYHWDWAVEGEFPQLLAEEADLLRWVLGFHCPVESPAQSFISQNWAGEAVGKRGFTSLPSEADLPVGSLEEADPISMQALKRNLVQIHFRMLGHIPQDFLWGFYYL